eukprot:118578-Chlamydomonas_euryale.AAC.3
MQDICGDTFLRKLLLMPPEEAPVVGHADGPANFSEPEVCPKLAWRAIAWACSTVGVTLGCDDVATPRDGGSESQADADADADSAAAETRRAAGAPAQPVLCVDPRGLVESILEVRACLVLCRICIRVSDSLPLPVFACPRLSLPVPACLCLSPPISSCPLPAVPKAAGLTPTGLHASCRSGPSFRKR